MRTRDGRHLLLAASGGRLTVDGSVVIDVGRSEYATLYRHFAGLLSAGRSELDAEPLLLVADAFMLGERIAVEPFQESAK